MLGLIVFGQRKLYPAVHRICLWRDLAAYIAFVGDLICVDYFFDGFASAIQTFKKLHNYLVYSLTL